MSFPNCGCFDARSRWPGETLQCVCVILHTSVRDWQLAKIVTRKYILSLSLTVSTRFGNSMAQRTVPHPVNEVSEGHKLLY